MSDYSFESFALIYKQIVMHFKSITTVYLSMCQNFLENFFQRHVLSKLSKYLKAIHIVIMIHKIIDKITQDISKWVP